MTEPWDTYVREYQPINHCDACGRADYLTYFVSGESTYWLCEECRNPPVFGNRGQNNTKDESAHEKHSADAQEALDTEFGE